MREIPREQVLRRMQAENTWWESPHRIPESYYRLPHRAYFELLLPLIIETTVKRAVLLMGPRRVGKTVIIHHVIQRLIDDGLEPKRVCYLSVDHPLYNGCGLTELLEYFGSAAEIDMDAGPLFVFLDEVQYLKNWEVHLKSLVDTHPNIKFIASGSAAAALRLKGTESGAGRFTDFLLPPLTFYEYLDLLGQLDLMVDDGGDFIRAESIEELNARFVHYLNFGGYPEVIFSPIIQADPSRFIKGDIVDKVLLRDLPGLYGIQDIQELNHLFTTLAFNTASEVSLEQLSKSSGVAKNTIKRYIEYLEAAFLLKVVHRIDRSARRFQRANFFKVYLTNPSIRSALFSPIDSADEAMGGLTETGLFAQWFHADDVLQLHYARWSDGEVDIVNVGGDQRAKWAVEVKWSDRFATHPRELRSLLQFCRTNSLRSVVVTSRTITTQVDCDGVLLNFVPASAYCYNVGYNLIVHKRRQREVTAPTAVQ